jgi:hypothetical protein
MQKYKNVVLGVFAVLAPIVAYLLQVDPLSLCKPGIPVSTGGGSVNLQQLDAGSN